MNLSRREIVETLEAVQGDANTRAVELHLFDNGAAWNVPEGVTAAVAFRKPDGHKGLYDTLPDGTAAVSIEGSTVTAILAPQVLSCAGEVAAAVVLTDKDRNRIATFPFPINVAKDPSGGSGISSDSGADSGTGSGSGADGISCYHSWDGTVLTITSASGTSSADLKGEKGEKGDTGPAGGLPYQGTVTTQAELDAATTQGIYQYVKDYDSGLLQVINAGTAIIQTLYIYGEEWDSMKFRLYFGGRWWYWTNHFYDDNYYNYFYG